MRRYFSRIILTVVVIGSAVFLARRVGDISQILRLSRSLNPLSVGAALLLAFGLAEAGARVLQRSFSLTGTGLRFRDAAKLYLAAFFVQAVVPGGFFSGTSFLAASASRFQSSQINILMGVALNLFINYLAFLLIFLAASVIHIFSPSASPSALLAAQALATFTVLLVVVSVAVARQTALIIKAIGWVKKLFGARGRLVYINKAGDIIRALFEKWHLIFTPLGDGLFYHLMGAGILWAIFLGLGYPVPLNALAAGYIVGALFTIVSITPAGIGVVEVAMPLALFSLGVPLPLATAATLIYRAFTFWFLLLLGSLAFRNLGKQIVSE